MSKYHIPLHPDKYYHIFNQAIGDELLFRNEDNFEFFLKKYARHTECICDTFSYILMPDHFHFAIKIKSIEDCAARFEVTKKTPFDSSRHDLSDFLMERFSNLCNSYAKSYNKVFARQGALFIDYLKRSEMSDDSYLRNLINYIHFNAVYHGLCKSPFDWKWSSLRTFVSGRNTKVKRKDALKLFGGFENFKIAHRAMVRPLSEYEFL